MITITCFIVLFATLSCSCVFAENAQVKLSETNRFIDGHIRQDLRPFRTKKANILWEKAKDHMSESRMQRLYLELLKHDQESLDLKRLVHDGLDEHGIKRANHKQKLMLLLNKYHLDEVLPEELLEPVEPEENEVVEELPELSGASDLNKLYLLAKKQGFSVQELKNLREELGHQKKRIDDWEIIRQQVKDLADAGNEAKELRSKMASEFMRLKEEYEVLYKRVHSNSTGFEESRVLELWTLVEGKNYTEEELGKIKEELSHFEARIRKQRHLSDEARAAEAKILHEPEHVKKDPEADHNKKWDRAQSFSQKVRKMYNDIRKKIEKQVRLHGSEL